MKSYLSLVSEYSKVHKKKGRLTIICIAISVMLIVSVFGMAEMSVTAQIDDYIRKNGNWHAIVTDLSDGVAADMSGHSSVRVSGWIGVAEDTEYAGSPLLVQGGEQAIAEEMNLVLSEGKYPVSAQEALLDEGALTQFDISIGDTIEISFSDGKTRPYTITGSYKDFSSLKGDGAHGLYLSVAGVRALPPESWMEYYYIQFASGSNINQVVSEIIAEHGLSEEQVSINKMLLGLMGQSDDSSMVHLYITAIILALLIMAVGTFMIASSFNMSMLERTQFFGLLRCMGATKRQVKRYVRVEGLRYSLIGIPIGLLAGCGIVCLAVIFLNTLNSQYLPEMPLRISWIGVLGGSATGFVTVMLASRSPAKKAAAVSPQAAVTGNIDYKNDRKIQKASSTTLFHVDTAMGLRHAFSNKKSMVFITGSFAISIVLFLCFSVLISFMNHALKPLQPYAADISITGADSSVRLGHPLMEELKALPDASKVYGRMFLYDVPATAGQRDGAVILVSYDDPQFEWAEGMLTAGNANSVRDGNDVFVCFSDDLAWNVGDRIALDISGEITEVEIAGVLSDAPFQGANNEWVVICSEDTFTSLTGITDYTIIDMQVESDISGQVRSLLTSDLHMRDKIQSNAEIKSTFDAMAVFVYGFLIVIALIALINILNTVSASVSSRMNHYGVMRAVGMSGRQLKKTIIAETAAYAITGCIVGSVLGLLLHRLFYGLLITSNWGGVWQPPIAVLAVTVLVAFLTTFVSVHSVAGKIKEMSIVNVVNAG